MLVITNFFMICLPSRQCLFLTHAISRMRWIELTLLAQSCISLVHMVAVLYR